MVVVAWLATLPAHGASSAVVVSLQVQSVTSLDMTGCAAGAPGTTFGTVLPATSAVTSADCTVGFGATGSGARLHVRQSDGRGVAMWQPSAGALDTTFNAGTAVAPFIPGASDDRVFAMAVQPDGKVLLAGFCPVDATTGIDYCVLRFTTAGVLDSTFGSGGKATVAMGVSNAEDRAHAVVVQPDGRIILGGYCQPNYTTGFDACLVRLTTGGGLDPSFDTDGRVTTAIAPGMGADQIYDIAVQPDGRILASGPCNTGATSSWDFCTIRYLADGSLDTSFDVDGRVTTPVGPGTGIDEPQAVRVAPDGRVVVAGTCAMGAATGNDLCAVRYLANGSLDASFDADGRVSIAIGAAGAEDRVYDAVVQPDSRVVVAGHCTMGGSTGIDFCVARTNVDGSLDGSFHDDGIVTASSPGATTDAAFGMVVQPDGAVVTSGMCWMGATTGYDMCLMRHRADGSLDTGFGAGGIVAMAFGPGAAEDRSYGIALGTDGQLVSGGYCHMGAATIQDACALVLRPAQVVDQYADASRDWDTTGTQHFGMCLRAVAAASASMPSTGSCPASDGAWWSAVPSAAVQVAATSSATPGQAHVRFGVRTAAAQGKGAYVAPITFEVVAP